MSVNQTPVQAASQLFRLDVLAIAAGAGIAAGCLLVARMHLGLDDRDVLLLCVVAAAGAGLALTGALGLMHLALLRYVSRHTGSPRKKLPPER